MAIMEGGRKMGITNHSPGSIQRTQLNHTASKAKDAGDIIGWKKKHQHGLVQLNGDPFY